MVKKRRTPRKDADEERDRTVEGVRLRAPSAPWPAGPNRCRKRAGTLEQLRVEVVAVDPIDQ